jgi:hypothetical protein
LVALDPTGSAKWTRVLDGCQLSSLKIAPDGGFYFGVVGCDHCFCDFGASGNVGDTTSNPAIAKFDSSGKFVWSRSLSGDGLSPLVAIGNSGVFVGGSVTVPPNDKNGLLELFVL